MKLSIIILAAGHGKRMGSALPKVLHTMAGKPMLEHVVQAASKLNPEQLIVVYGYQGAMVQAALQHHAINWVEQKEQLGTGHAVLQALPVIPDNNQVLILYGDVPRITATTLHKFIQQTPKDALGILTAHFPDPTGIGRILRDESNKIIGVVEEKEADIAQRKINEVNVGFYLAPVNYLKQWLPKLNNRNAQQEYYLTDIIALAVQESITVHASRVDDYREVIGVNDQFQLAEVNAGIADS